MTRLTQTQMRYGGMKHKPTVFCFIHQKWGAGDCVVAALAEDGKVIAQHLSSNRYFAQIDIGYRSQNKHDTYKAHYPDGYRIEWIEEEVILNKSNPRFERAVERNKKYGS